MLLKPGIPSPTFVAQVNGMSSEGGGDGGKGAGGGGGGLTTSESSSPMFASSTLSREPKELLMLSSVEETEANCNVRLALTACCSEMKASIASGTVYELGGLKAARFGDWRKSKAKSFAQKPYGHTPG